MRDNGGRLAPLAGVGAVVLVLAGFALTGDTPDATKDSAREVVSGWADKGDGVVAGLVLVSLGVALLVFFGSYLRRVLTVAEGGDGVLPRMAFAGTVLIAAGACFDSTLVLSLQQGADDISPAGVQALSLLYDNDFIPMATGMFLLLIGVGVPILRTGVLPKWLGAVAILFAVISPTPIGFVGAIGGAVLIAVMGVVLAVRAGRTPAAAAPV